MTDADDVGAPISAVPAIAIEGVGKIYGRGKRQKTALHQVDLRVPKGSIFGLLGPNGAGKSTLINILAGLVIKTSGRAAVWGYDIDRQTRAARAAIGVVPQELNIDPFFSPKEMLEFHAGLYGVPAAERRTNEILAAMHLTDKANAYARTLSGGMRRRLLIAKALVHRPPVVVLDEPTAGVDIGLRQQLWRYVRALNRDGMTVVLTTHYLEEAEAMCDRIAILNHGRIVACDDTQALLAQMQHKTLQVTLAEALTAIPAPLRGFQPVLRDAHQLCFHLQPGDDAVAKLLAAISASGLTVTDLTTEQADLEDVFLALTGEGAAAE